MTSKIYLLFDFETSGVGADFKKQRAIQLAWMTVEKDGEIFHELNKHSFLIKGITDINKDFHGEHLTVDMLDKHGDDGTFVYNIFLKDLQKVIDSGGKLVAHNIDFDFDILYREMTIYSLENKVDWVSIRRNNLLCTMKKSVKICKLTKEGYPGFKYPRLYELYRHYFGKLPETKLHLAHNDVDVMYDCFKLLLDEM